MIRDSFYSIDHLDVIRSHLSHQSDFVALLICVITLAALISLGLQIDDSRSHLKLRLIGIHCIFEFYIKRNQRNINFYS